MPSSSHVGRWRLGRWHIAAKERGKKPEFLCPFLFCCQLPASGEAGLWKEATECRVRAKFLSVLNYRQRWVHIIRSILERSKIKVQKDLALSIVTPDSDSDIILTSQNFHSYAIIPTQPPLLLLLFIIIVIYFRISGGNSQYKMIRARSRHGEESMDLGDQSRENEMWQGSQSMLFFPKR